ncbi:hypothetical protein [Methylorubrum extorquens]
MVLRTRLAPKQVGTVPWDGFPVPLIVRQDGIDLRRDGDFLHVDAS